MLAATARWRETRGIETALTVLFSLVALVAAVRAVALGSRLVVLDDPDASDFVSRARDADDFVRVTDVLLGLVVLVIVPCFIVWCFCAAKNHEALGREPQRLSAGWAIGGWFIPLANLVIPVLLIQDLWRGSDARIAWGDPRWRIADRSWLVGWWWGLSVVALFTFTGSPVDQHELDITEVRATNLLAILSMLCTAVSAVMAILVVRHIDRRQAECRDAFALTAA